MSFSFQARAADKTALREAIAAEMDKVIVGQPIHAADKILVVVVANAYLDFLADNPDMDVAAHISGSLSWSGTSESPNFTGANVSVGVYHAPRKGE